MHNPLLRLLFTSPIAILFYSFSTFGNEAYFDMSDPEIEIQTNFKGKEVIIFGLSEPEIDTIIDIKGPALDTRVRKKERIFGMWFNRQKIIYRDLPSIFFIASSSPINEILNEETIIKRSLYFEQSIVNLITQRNFNFTETNKLANWNKSLIQIKKEEEFNKKYKIKIVDNKLFQTRIFFPSNTVTGIYDVKIYQVKDKIIVGEKNKKIIIKKTGIGEKIYQWAQNDPAYYGIVCILFAIFAGLVGATAFRRL